MTKELESTQKFAQDALATMFRYYGVDLQEFRIMLETGCTRVQYGRSRVGFVADDVQYIVSFAAFINPDSQFVDTLEVWKDREDGSISYKHGLKRSDYTEEEFIRLKERYGLVVCEEELETVINRLQEGQVQS